jgi:ABC-type multidrug transport system ATPase subunit
MSSKELEAVVSDVIAELGLESVRDTYIGTWHLRGVSGGQRRRVSIGCELVTSPRLVFLDEPTSGLDSAAAYHVMAAVGRLAQRCRTIIRRAALGRSSRQTCLSLPARALKPS